MSYPEVVLGRAKEIQVVGGHPWVFSNAIVSIKDNRDIAPGSLVKVVSDKGAFVGVGTYNPNTSIRIRIISRVENETINVDFICRKLLELDKIKSKYLPPNTSGYRVVHADADGLPGLVLDKYGDVYVFQLHTWGMENLRQEVIAAVTKAFSPRVIVERSDVISRREEGLQTLAPQIHFGKLSEEIVFTENNIKFVADVMKGQKTGFFLDQKEARIKLGKYCPQKTVLNLFCYSASFSVCAALAGAREVVSVDVSAQALEIAQRNFKLNGLDSNKFKFIKEDVFAFLKKEDNTDFEVIICDPPAFAKSQNKIKIAVNAYEKINNICFEKAKQDTIFVTSSCSGRITQEEFRNVLKVAAGKARRNARVVDYCGQSADHTEILAFPEGKYLKTFFVEVRDI